MRNPHCRNALGAALTVLLAVLAACSGSDTDEAQTVWDFREPLTGFDLGGSGDFAAFDDDGGDLLVILPTGERLDLSGKRSIDAYRSNYFGNNPAPGVLDQVLYGLGPPGDVSQLQSTVSDFTERWGEASSPDDSDDTATNYVAGLTDDVDGDAVRTRFFEATTASGEVAKIGINATSDGEWAAGVTLSFRPPSAANA